MKLLLATANRHKIEEISEILAAYPVQLVDLRDFPPVDSPEENGDSYYANALIKARFYGAHTGLPALADDSGLEVDALGGAPGLISARWEPGLSQAQKNLQVLERARGKPQGARFRCCSLLAYPDRPEVVFCDESCEGTLAAEPRGVGGFGYDPIFMPDGSAVSMAELSPAEKHRLSHRGRSLRGLFAQLFPHPAS